MINRAPFERLELELGAENIILLSGINGAGKTTILSYIVDAFYELAKNGYQGEFENRNTKFYRISSSLFSLDTSKPSVVYLRFVLDNGSYADYVDMRGLCSRAEYESLIGLSNIIPYSKIERTLKDSEVAKYWTISDKKAIQSLFSSNLLTYFPAYRYETPYYLNGPYKFHLDFNKDTSFSGYLTNPIEVTSDLPDIANWIMDLVLDQQLYKGEAQSVFSELNNILTFILLSKVQTITRVGIGRRFAGASRIAIMDRLQEGHQIYPSIFNMSSGELALLCLFVELLKQTDKNRKQINEISGIVLVDEIDKHLHIRLQKEVLPKLFEMFPKVQFIASSHSPFLGLGLSESATVTNTIYDLDNNGIPCQPQDNELFKEIYNMMIIENDRYASKYKALQSKMKESNKPLIITEGKTDWKHLKSAVRALNITDLDIDFCEFEDALGDVTLLKMLKDYARFEQPRPIIGIFDRDNFSRLKYPELETQEYVSLQNNVYAFSIPLANTEEYGTDISIEHYYKRADLTKADTNGRRLFLGSEFLHSGMSKDKKYHSRASNIENKAKNNGIVDEKVYIIETDAEEEHSVALSKNDYAELVLNQEGFATDFDFSEFTKIFDVIRKVILGVTEKSDSD